MRALVDGACSSSDDNPDALELLETMLATLGYDVCGAPDGPSALALAQTFHR